MRVVGQVDVVGDPVLGQRMAWGTLAILVAGALAGLVWWADPTHGHEGVGPLWWLALAVAVVASLATHELVHGACFRLLGGAGTRVGFGARQGLLYTTAHGAVLTRGRFMAVLLAPTLAASLAVALACGAAGVPIMGWVALVVHLSGCVGDWAMVAAIAREPAATHVRDAEDGIELLAEG